MMIGSFVELHARDKKCRLNLASGSKLTGIVREVADDGTWMIVEVLDPPDTGLLYVNCGLVESFEVLG
jgi:hypothetical protein